VYAAVFVRGDIRDAHFQFDADDPSVVVHRTVRAALELLRDALPPASDSSSTKDASAQVSTGESPHQP
jgi:hypothetical protein